MPAEIFTDYELDLAINDRVVVPVKEWGTATVQADHASGSWGTATIRVKRSNDGANWYDLLSPVVVTAQGVTNAIDVSAFGWLSVEVDTLEGAAGAAKVSVCVAPFFTEPSEPDRALAIAAGRISGHSAVNKFGANSAVASGTTEDVWDGSALYTFPATADITHLRQAVDQAAMRSQVVEVQGLDTNYAAVTQNVTLDAANTTTAVALGTALRRVFRMKVLANVVTTQNVELRNVGGGTTYALILAGNNQTLMAIYTVPAGKTAYMTNFYGTIIKSTANAPDSVDFRLWVADRANSYEFQIKHAQGAPLTAGGVRHNWNPYFKVTEKSDIKIAATASGGIANVNAGFDLILVDN